MQQFLDKHTTADGTVFMFYEESNGDFMVSDSDGGLYVLDAQHRTEAYQELYEKFAHTPLREAA